jgi:hypothetical protein
MSDAAFATAKFPTYTTKQLTAFIAEGRDLSGSMANEITRRAKVADGDFSVMTPGERLRYVSRS